MGVAVTDEMRLVLAPSMNPDASYGVHDGQAHGGMRWARENGHPGCCGPDCWHSTPEAAMACFRGERE